MNPDTKSNAMNSWLQLSSSQSWYRMGHHRIRESFMLEKTSKITESNHQPNTTLTAKPCPEVPHLHSFWTGLRTVTPSQPIPMSDHSFSKEIFINIQSKPPLTQLEAIAFRPIASYLGEETNTCLTTISFQVAVENISSVSSSPD